MMTGVGEAPCEILSYESDGLPSEYRGQLLVTSWADHRVERYAVKPHGRIVQGGAFALRARRQQLPPNRHVYRAGWFGFRLRLGAEQLHAARQRRDLAYSPKGCTKGRFGPTDPKEAIFSMHRPLREAAAKKLTVREGWAQVCWNRFLGRTTSALRFRWR